jgi:hypothetical protein
MYKRAHRRARNHTLKAAPTSCKWYGEAVVQTRRRWKSHLGLEGKEKHAYPHHPLLSRSFHVAVLDGRAGAKRGNRRMKAKQRKGKERKGKEKSRVSPYRNDIKHEKARREQGFDFLFL